MAQIKTPGVYPIEESAFPNSVVEVATAVPAFLGYTEKAARGTKSLTNVPTRISSLAEFNLLFGGAPNVKFDLADADGKMTLSPSPNTRFLLYFGLRMFFDNGGGACWIVSVGDYGDADNPRIKSKADFDGAWGPLDKEQEPTMIVVPDAVLLPQDDYIGVANKALVESADLKSRVALLDVFDGHKPRTHDDTDVISGTKGFRNAIENDSMSYGMAYYPWLHTNVLSGTDVSFVNLTEAGAGVLHDAIAKDLSDAGTTSAFLTNELGKIKAAPDSGKALTKTHQTLLGASARYKEVMGELLNEINVMPPSAAMAGVYTRTDNSEGRAIALKV